MDFSVFKNEKFDTKEWINEIFYSESCSTSKEIQNYASNIAKHLQQSIQDINSTIEDISSQVVSNLPHVLRDIESLSNEASLLKSQMRDAKTEIEKVELSTASSMQTLVQLDTIKARVLDTSKALKEADNWTTLSADIEEVMEKGDIAAISDKLILLQNCLNLLQNVHDYDDKLAHLEGLKVRLEALLSPQLVAAFCKHDSEQSQKYAKILHTLGRSENLMSYYYKCETQNMVVTWRSMIEMSSMSSSPLWLINFYHDLSSFVNKQVRWCEKVFEEVDPLLLLAELTNNILTALDPPISEVVLASIKQQEEPLVFLATVKKAGDDFLEDYKKLADNFDGKRDVKSVNKAVFVSIYKPLKDQLSQYQDYEESVLLSHLILADIVREDTSESLSNMTNYCGKILPQVEDAIKRCVTLTDGFSFPQLIQAVETYMENVLERLSQITRLIEQQSASINDDWTVFNTCLMLIRASGEFLTSVDAAEYSLMSSLTEMATMVTKSNDEFSTRLILEEKQIKNVQKLVENCVVNNRHLLDAILTSAQKQCERSVDVGLNTITSPVTSKIAKVSKLSSWFDVGASNLAASFSPQEYITEIGQYLMTLPQHLEPLLVNQSSSLNRALQVVDSKTGSENRIVSESEVSAAEFLISKVSELTSKAYCDAILRIPSIAPNMITQLTTDIDYICDIFEDLGVSSCDPLDKLNILLKVPAKDYWDVAPGNIPRLVAAVRQIRDISAKS